MARSEVRGRRVLNDGRSGWPDIVQYLITEGPYAGELRDVPPSTIHDADLIDPTPTKIVDGKVLSSDGRPKTYAYRPVVHDWDNYYLLMAEGWIDSDEHRGRTPPIIDNRKAML